MDILEIYVCGDRLLIFYPQIKWIAHLPNIASSMVSQMFFLSPNTHEF